MRIVELIIEFIFGIIKKAILVGLVSAILLFLLLAFTIFIPDQVINAFEILTGLVGS